jgi:dipeptidyl aminopeptidase/acylaminoacyl peptidase
MTTSSSPTQPNRAWRLAASVVLCLAAGLPLGAADVLTPQDVARLRSVAEAALSPDGQRVAYALRVPRDLRREDDGPEWVELHLVGLEGVSRPFITGRLSVSRIAWTPDGGEIAFLAKREGDKAVALYVIPADGGEALRLIQLETDIKEYSFSPDGRRVAFLAEEPLAEAKKKRAEKGFRQEIYEEEWRPVGVWIAERDTAAGQPRRLTLEGSASELHWSPVDSRLAVALAPTSLIDDHYMNRKVYVVSAETGETLARLDNPGKLGEIAWSPDGQHLAMISAADRNDPLEGRLMVAAAAGGALRDLLPGLEGHVADLAWIRPARLAYVADEGVWTSFNRVELEGSDRHTIVATGGPILSTLSVSADGQSAAFVTQSPGHPPEVYFMQHGEAGPRRLTNSNPWLAERRLAPQEVVQFEATDGLTLEGILIRPLDAVEGRQYPLILTVHGGPEEHFRNGWLTTYALPGQVAAGRGFAVFYPNYRGSTGRGVAFSKLSQGDPAGKEFDDLMDGVDHLIEQGLADPDRVGITGGSYGGYATAWGATYYSEHFAAAVMRVGISELLAKEGTTDIPQENYDVHFQVYPWDDWELFLERSPIRYAENARTPLLIAHGKDDPRVHPSQSLILYRYLKEAGKAPVRLVYYPGEGHASRRASSRLDYNLRMLEWFEHYLKGPGGEPPPYELDYGLKEAAPKSSEGRP